MLNRMNQHDRSYKKPEKLGPFMILASLVNVLKCEDWQESVAT